MMDPRFENQDSTNFLILSYKTNDLPTSDFKKLGKRFQVPKIQYIQKKFKNSIFRDAFFQKLLTPRKLTILLKTFKY